ncbi:hypothetical protein CAUPRSCDRAFT_12039 [Caulochytrium protostelioides]|uniref:Uncharacterized protein n=1 Tax=Caulochytrium protostelioides TaxID=1555241 RepID=A0A4V1IT94_9FUNG|nr:hypothetical protein CAUPRSCDRAFT_12039 [Caulochytrium protostelioides]
MAPADARRRRRRRCARDPSAGRGLRSRAGRHAQVARRRRRRRRRIAPGITPQRAAGRAQSHDASAPDADSEHHGASGCRATPQAIPPAGVAPSGRSGDGR